MTAQWYVGIVFGLVWPWTVVAIHHRHVRLDLGCPFLSDWEAMSLTATIASLTLGAATAGARHNVAHWCYGVAIGATASAVIAALIGWWKRSRRAKAIREYGGKSLKRIADLVQALRDSTRPRPVWQPAPGGAA